MWPLAAFFDRMKWPLFHSWGLVHGSFLVAWPALSATCFLLLYIMLGLWRSDERD